MSTERSLEVPEVRVGVVDFSSEPPREPVRGPCWRTLCLPFVKPWLGETRSPGNMWKPLQTNNFLWPNRYFHIF